MRRSDRDVETWSGSLLFLCGAAATALGLLLPHDDALQEGGYAAMAGAFVAVAVLLHVVPRSWRPATPYVTVALGIAAVSVSHALNGEGAGGPPVLNELFYVWPLLYVGYFLGLRALALALVATAVGYTASCLYHGLPTAEIVSRTAIVLAVLGGTALAAEHPRRHADRLVARLNALARTDALTGVANRRAFDERLQAEIARHARTGEPFTLVLADVDHFKRLNDREGHAAGDAALVRLAGTLQRHARRTDAVFRVGGEEFALLLPGTTLAEGVAAADRLRPWLLPLTLSFGVVEAGGDGVTADELLRAADRALYAAKDAGRDAIATARAPATA